MDISFLVVNFVLFMAKLFSSRHEDTKSLRTDNKIKSSVSLCLGGKFLSGLSGLGIGLTFQ